MLLDNPASRYCNHSRTNSK
jgi:hypothetical protein